MNTSREIMFSAFASQDDNDGGDMSVHLPANDPYGFSEKYGNIDKYYGGTLDDESDSEGEEEREAREKKNREEIEAEMRRIQAKEKRREEKIALMRKHGLLGSDSEPSSDDESDSEVEIDTPPTSPRLLDPIPRSIMHKERIEQRAEPMLWTEIIQPDGPSGFDDDVARGLERPLTPEPTSDDEDAAFEAELLAMQAKEKIEQEGGGEKKEKEEEKEKEEKEENVYGDEGERKEKKEAPESVFCFSSLPSHTLEGRGRGSGSGDEDDHVDSNTDTRSSHHPPTTIIKSKSKANSTDEEAVGQEEDRANTKAEAEAESEEEIVPDKVILQRKLERKAYLARMRKKMKFDAMFDVQGSNREHLVPLFRQNPDKEMRHKDNKAVKSLMPAERGHALMSRLYKRSALSLRECVAGPNALNLTGDPISKDADAPSSIAHSLLAKYRKMIEVIDVALIRAPINDATARREFVAYRNTLAKRRTDAAHKVSNALKLSTECQKRYDKKHDELVGRLQEAAEPKRPKIREFIVKVKSTYRDEMLELGEAVVVVQQDEEKEVSQCQQLEETCVRVLTHWRPIHAKLFEEAKLVRFRLQALIRIISVRVIQRTARRRLLMFYRGTPEELEDDMLRDLEKRMLAKKKKVYKMRPW